MRRTHPFRNRRPPTQILRAGKSTRENPRRLSGSTHRHRAHKGSADPQLSVVTSLIATPVAAVNERQPTMSASTPHVTAKHVCRRYSPFKKYIEEGPEESALRRPVGDGERDVGERAETRFRAHCGSQRPCVADHCRRHRTHANKSVRHDLTSVRLPLTSPVVFY